MLTETPMEMAMLLATVSDETETMRATVTERAVVMMRMQPSSRRSTAAPHSAPPSAPPPSALFDSKTKKAS